MPESAKEGATGLPEGSDIGWVQETVRSSRTTRTTPPLKSWISEGFSFSLSIAAPHRADLTVMPEGEKRRLTCT